MKKKIKIKYFVAPILLVMSFSLSIVCAAFSQDMFISGEAYARINKNVRIMSISFEEGTNGGTQEANPKFNEITTITYSKLPNLNSTVKYKIKVRNNTSNYINVYDITDTIPQNSVFDYDLDLTSLDSTYHSDLLDPGTEAFIYLTIKYKEGATLPESEDDQKAIITNKYDFDAIYANELSYSNSTYTSCTNVQCALDDVKAILNNGSELTPASKYTERFIKSHTNSNSYAEDDPDNNLRYIGANPNNYVRFNNQSWRIIGVFNGKLKIVSPSIGTYSWDSSAHNVNSGSGVNAWHEADLMKLLNPGYENNIDYRCIGNYSGTKCGDDAVTDFEQTLVNNSLYWNGGSGYCYDYADYRTKSCNFSSNGLTDAASRTMIDDSVWYLGSNAASADLWGSGEIVTASFLYNIERSSLTGKQCSSSQINCTDQVARTATWTGKVGLIYPSDYAYATGGGTGVDRATCLLKQVGYVEANTTPNWSNTYTDCKNNDWLLGNAQAGMWPLSPRASSGFATSVFYVDSAGHIASSNARFSARVRPVVYLKSTVTFTGNGHGTSTDPYTLYDTATSS